MLSAILRLIQALSPEALPTSASSLPSIKSENVSQRCTNSDAAIPCYSHHLALFPVFQRPFPKYEMHKPDFPSGHIRQNQSLQ